MSWMIVVCLRYRVDKGRLLKWETAPDDKFRLFNTQSETCKTPFLYHLRKKTPKRYSTRCPSCGMRHRSNGMTLRNFWKPHVGRQPMAQWRFDEKYETHKEALEALNKVRYGYHFNRSDPVLPQSLVRADFLHPRPSN